MSDILNEIYDCILDMDDEAIGGKVQEALDEGISPQEILEKGMVSAMDEIGRQYEAGDFFIPEMLVCAETMKAGIEVLRPHLSNAGVEPAGKIVAGTVKGDLHDIGKSLLCMMLEGAAFEIIDLGADVDEAKFIEAVKEFKPDFLAMSAMLTTTRENMKTVIDLLEENGLRDQVKVLVGGAPVNQDFAEKIGADGYASDANRAVAMIKKMAE